MQKATLVTCVSCGWVHNSVSVQQVQKFVDDFNVFYTAAPEYVKEQYSGLLSLSDFDHCFHCGSKGRVRVYKEGDCPRGSTIQTTTLFVS